MDNKLSLHIKMFNDKVKLMNQSNSKQLILSAAEARNLQADLFDLLNYCAILGRSITSKTEDPVVTVAMDGGNF